ncbi:ABC-type transport system involved in multi-copper enzyme maturation, permease component [Pseudomonas peli]|uniref:ABC-type transport system involved in multi-copper enzyme maturation, permease component n=1 Tax=Pseudomonas peli TaxID=592361 RepID=A0AB37Z674_9PSED|nr:ABC transporter permease [Pseudomonas peli]NMZ68537.1 ABC transporter permease [Pseudomonas peli]SCW43414.1 ABC-type transport system involved in multi-copper enzyme maturation, permease component [Pseudomonas peli]
MFELTALGMRAGIRGQGFRILLLITLALLGVALLAGNFSGRQPLTVALDVGLSGLRFVLLLMALLWVQDLLARDIERKTIYFLLAYPVTRSQFLFSRFLAVAVLSGGALVFVGLALWLVLYLFGSSHPQLQPPALGMPYMMSLLGIWLDLLVVVAFAILLASISTTPYLPLLLGFAFALAARGLGPTISHLRSARSDPLHEALFSPVLEHAYAWLPDLSRLDWRALALYGLTPDMPAMVLAVLNAAAYIVLLLTLAAVVFQRRNFT